MRALTLFSAHHYYKRELALRQIVFLGTEI